MPVFERVTSVDNSLPGEGELSKIFRSDSDQERPRGRLRPVDNFGSMSPDRCSVE